MGDGTAASKTGADLLGNRRFGSISLQRRVRCEPPACGSSEPQPTGGTRNRGVSYEWKRTGTGKQPYAIALADRSTMALAGLWENWKSPADEWVRSFAILTTEPNELCAELHDRMPVILAPETWLAWLGEEPVQRRASGERRRMDPDSIDRVV